MDNQFLIALSAFYQAHKEWFLIAGGAATTPTFRFVLTTITKIARREGDLLARENTVEIKEFIQAKFDGLNDKFDGLNDKFDGLEDRFDTLESKVDTGFNQVNTRLDSLDKRVFTIEELLSTIPFLNFRAKK